VSLFITFEGPEGSGKTTQIRLLAERLEALGRAVLTTREPGGTRIGNRIRTVLLDAAHTEMSPRAEALLFSAARAQLVDEVIRPALESGIVVLCDRYADSTLAYQGYGHGQALEPLTMLGDYATRRLTPDLTIYLDVESETGLQRKQAGAAEEWNRMEEQALAFHQAVRAGYLALAAADPKRWLLVDAAQAVDAVQRVIWQRVEPFCAEAPSKQEQQEPLDMSVQHQSEQG
jgi:dTMP kinase